MKNLNNDYPIDIEYKVIFLLPKTFTVHKLRCVNQRKSLQNISEVSMLHRDPPVLALTIL